MAENTSKFHEVLHNLHTTPPNRDQQQQCFVDRIKRFLAESPEYRDLFLEVQTYEHWTGSQRVKAPTPRFDLVATDTSQKFWGIVCKYQDPTTTIPKSFTTSFCKQVTRFACQYESEYFQGFVLVSPSRIGANPDLETLQETMVTRRKSLQIIDYEELFQSKYDWPIPALEIKDLCRCYSQGNESLEVLQNVNLAIPPGESVALVGPSGSGKSTLLQMAGLLDTPDSGNVQIAGFDATGKQDSLRTTLRRVHIGFVYQFHHLLPELSALENVSSPLWINDTQREYTLERAQSLLVEFGLAERTHHLPGELSGGEQQRVAICRALASKPTLLLADEPTGNLDPDTAESVLNTLLESVKHENLALLAATHNPEIAARMNRVVTLHKGCLEEIQ